MTKWNNCWSCGKIKTHHDRPQISTRCRMEHGYRECVYVTSMVHFTEITAIASNWALANVANNDKQWRTICDWWHKSMCVMFWWLVRIRSLERMHVNHHSWIRGNLPSRLRVGSLHGDYRRRSFRSRGIFFPQYQENLPLQFRQLEFPPSVNKLPVCKAAKLSVIDHLPQFKQQKHSTNRSRNQPKAKQSKQSTQKCHHPTSSTYNNKSSKMPRKWTNT